MSIVGYSRMFNGSHSLDQVLTGALIGIWLAYFGHFALRYPIYRHVDGLLTQYDADGPQEKPQGAPLKAFWYFALAFLSTAGAYYYNIWTFTIPESWL